MSNEPTNEVTETGTKLEVDPSRPTRITLRLTKSVKRLNCERVRFNTDSAILMPTGLRVIAAAFEFARANPGLKLLIASHTDRQGSEESNQDLSEARAKNVLLMTTGERNPWIEANGRDNTRLHQDVRQVLAWAHKVWNFPCDPGKVTNDPKDQKLTDAISAFKVAFSKRFSTNYVEKAEVGDVDGSFWARVFNLYAWTLVEHLRLDKPADLKPLVDQLAWVDPDQRSIGCGEKAPLVQTADGVANDDNRRTEFLFFPAGQEPPKLGFESDPDPAAYLKAVYLPKRYKFEPVECPPPLFFGEEIPEGTVVFVIDVSGSMAPHKENGDRIGVARRNLNLALDDLPDGTPFGIVSYSSDVTVLWPDAQAKPQVKPANDESRAAASRWVNALGPLKLTNTYGGLERAFQAVGVDAGKPRTIKLLSDGEPTPKAALEGKTNSASQQAAADERKRILDAVQGWSGGAWRVDTVGLFKSATEKGPLVDFMRALAEQNGGKFTHVAVGPRQATPTR